MIIVEVVNITIQLRLIVRAIVKGVVNIRDFIVIRGTIIIIIIFVDIRVIFMTKFIIIVIIIISRIIRESVIMIDRCYALCLFK